MTTMKNISIHPIAAASVVAASISLGGLGALNIAGNRTADPVASSEYPAQTLGEALGTSPAPGLSQTKREPADEGTRAEHVALSPRQRLDLQQQIVDARCLLAGGSAEGQTPETRCTVTLPALPEIPRGR